MFSPTNVNVGSRTVNFRFDIDKGAAANLKILREQFATVQAASERAQKQVNPQYVSDIKRTYFLDVVVNYKAKGSAAFQRLGVEVTDLDNLPEKTLTLTMPSYGDMLWMVETIGCYREYRNMGTSLLPSWQQVGTYTKVSAAVVSPLFEFKVLTPEELRAAQAAAAAAAAAADAAAKAAAAAVKANENPGSAAANAGGQAAVNSLNAAAAAAAAAKKNLETDTVQPVTDNAVKTTPDGFTLAGLSWQQAALLLLVLGGAVFGAIKMMRKGG